MNNKFKELPIDFVQDFQYSCNTSFVVQDNIFNNIMPCEIMCVVLINSGQPCL